ncbi:MAG: hypothetical protein IJN06_07085 [Bacteroidales bacterium]|nr:hypothetical protein [Bacteroidales bacterium]
MKTKTEHPYKLGDLIVITRRKCSDKVQPKIKVGGHYLVLKESRLKSGALTLSVADFATMAREGIKDPHAKIDPKMVMQCNQERFEWKRKSQKELLARFNEFKEGFKKEQEQKEEAFLKERFSEAERIRMAYYPYIYAELAWYYSLRALEIVKERRIEALKRTSRQLQEYRCNFMFDLARKMGHEVLDCAQGKVLQMLQDRQMDFFVFFTTVQNEINRQHVGIPDDDVKAYAYMSKLCIESQQRLDDENVEMIRQRLGFATRHESFPYMSGLKTCMNEYMGNLHVKFTLPISTAVTIMEKNVMNLTL